MAQQPRRKTLEKNVVHSDQESSNKVKFICCRCGLAYSRAKGYFPVSHSPMYRGTGYLPICNNCVEDMYDAYLKELGSDKEALRRMCMKLDLYWNESIYKMVEKTTSITSRVRSYITKTNIIRYIDKTFDDTLREESLLGFSPKEDEEAKIPVEDTPVEIQLSEEECVIEQDVIDFWGPGYTPKMYMELQQRFNYWKNKFPNDAEMDIGTEAILRQICSLEIEINKDRAAGKSIDRNINVLNTLLGSAQLKPAQKVDTDAVDGSTPMGVWIKRWENERPIPDPDPELEDVDGIVRYISIWFLGHLCKMLGIRNTYCKLYEDELSKMRIARPEFEDDDDETLFNNIFESDMDGDEDESV